VAVGDASIWLKQPDCTLWYGRTLPWIQLHALGPRSIGYSSDPYCQEFNRSWHTRGL